MEPSKNIFPARETWACEGKRCNWTGGLDDLTFRRINEASRVGECPVCGHGRFSVTSETSRHKVGSMLEIVEPVDNSEGKKAGEVVTSVPAFGYVVELRAGEPDVLRLVDPAGEVLFEGADTGQRLGKRTSFRFRGQSWTVEGVEIERRADVVPVGRREIERLHVTPLPTVRTIRVKMAQLK